MNTATAPTAKLSQIPKPTATAWNAGHDGGATFWPSAFTQMSIWSPTLTSGRSHFNSPVCSRPLTCHRAITEIGTVFNPAVSMLLLIAVAATVCDVGACSASLWLLES
jgi:hypothetical protein